MESKGSTRRVGSTYDVVVERDIMLVMRDGVELATDIYLPARNGKPVEDRLPAVLLRTPYNKERWGPHLVRFFAEHGYLSVTQDCRGRFKSQGTFFPFRDEPNDGFDTIRWLADHPRCNGRVGMWGPSYMAWVQFHAATQNPPGLVAMIPHQGPINAYHHSMRTGGALHLGLLRWIVNMAATSQEAQKDPEGAAAVREMLEPQHFLEWCSLIPWRRGDTPLARFPAYEEAAFQLYFENPDYTNFWRQPGFAMDEYFDSFADMPTLWVTSWFDWYPGTISDGYQSMVRMGRKNQHILIGPWSHNNFRTTIGDVNFGNEGCTINDYPDFQELQLAWFDRWLRGDRSVDLGAPVRYFMMGGGDGRRGENGHLNHGGRWYEDHAWPPPSTRPTAYYLCRGGCLSMDAPAESESSTSYFYDPHRTVSSNGRCIVAYGPAVDRGFQGMGPRDQIDLETLPGHVVPGRPIAERPDVLVFQTDPLPRDVRIAGDIKVRLFVSSDALDTDFYVKLIDLHPPSKAYPNGYAFPVSEGILRARYRDGFERPRLMRAGEVYELNVPLQPAANLFKVGHCIRIDVYSSNFPNFDINRNTGDPTSRTCRVARNMVHHDSIRPSLLELPCLP